MAQIETTGSVPPRLIQAGRSQSASSDASASFRVWAPKIAVAVAIIGGGILAYTAPSVKLEGGETLNFATVSDKLTMTANGWVTTLSWFAGILAIIAAFVFPPSERFVQTIAVTFGAIVAMTTPYFVATHLTLI